MVVCTVVLLFVVESGHVSSGVEQNGISLAENAGDLLEIVEGQNVGIQSVVEQGLDDLLKKYFFSLGN